MNNSVNTFFGFNNHARARDVSRPDFDERPLRAFREPARAEGSAAPVVGGREKHGDGGGDRSGVFFHCATARMENGKRLAQACYLVSVAGVNGNHAHI